MTPADQLVKVFGLLYLEMTQWWTEHVGWDCANVIVRHALADLLLSGLEGTLSPNGPYVSAWNIAHHHAQTIRPEIIHPMGVQWRRKIPLPEYTETERQIEAYCLLHAARIEFHLGMYDTMMLSRAPMWVNDVGSFPQDKDGRPDVPERLLTALLGVGQLLTVDMRHHLLHQADIKHLRAILRRRHYRWVDMQIQIRQENSDGPDEQDHHPSHPQ